MKMFKFECKVLPVNNEVLVHLKNIESPGYVHCRISKFTNMEIFFKGFISGCDLYNIECIS